MINNNIATLKQHIQHAANLLESKSSTDEAVDELGSLIYLGNHHDAVPRDLILDPILEPGEIHTWMLMKIHVSNPMAATRIPSQNTLMETLKCSRPLVSRHLQILRALRWLTLCAEVRGADGKYRGVVYVQHDQPLSVPDTLSLDPGYIDFLEAPVKSDTFKRLRNIKNSVLTHTDYIVSRGQELDISPSFLEQVNVRFKSGSATDPLETHLACPAGSVYPGGLANLYGYTEPQQKDHVNKFNMDGPADNDHVNNINMVNQAEIGHKSSKNHVNNINAALPSSSSNSNKINTTTTPLPPPSDLDFPKCVSKSSRQIAYANSIIDRLPLSQRQFALDYLADRVKAGENGTEKAVGNPIQYLGWITRNVLDGTLPESSYGLRAKVSQSVSVRAVPEEESREENRRRWQESMRSLGIKIKPDGVAVRTAD